tara:strand:- start:1708 stop:3093 length:1386 start_codon:yes stop_codon:yes gene_type:complete
MAKVGINTGTAANAGDGSTLRAGANIINGNFDELYTALGDGSTLAPGIVTSIVAGSNISVTGTGEVTISASSSLWEKTDAGINTVSNVGVGTTNPRFSLEVGAVGASGTSLFVNGDARVTGILTIGTGSITLDPVVKQIKGIDEIIIGTATTVAIKQESDGQIKFENEDGKEASVGIGTTVSINTTGIVTATSFHGNVTGNVTGNLSGDIVGTRTLGTGVTVTEVGVVSATAYYGDGSQLSGVVSGITVEDEGSALSTLATTLDFVGSGVVASGTGATKTITIAGGGSGITVEDEGSALSTLATTLDFVGSGVVASGTGATKTITIAGGGGSLASRTTKSATTASLAAAASGDLSITAFKAYNLLKIAIDHPAWVRLYVDSASRTSDASRAEGTDPLPGSGVIAEVLTTTVGASTFLMSPAVFGWNNDGTPSTTVYAKVTNKEASTSRAITVTLTLIEAEA